MHAIKPGLLLLVGYNSGSGPTKRRRHDSQWPQDQNKASIQEETSWGMLWGLRDFSPMGVRGKNTVMYNPMSLTASVQPCDRDSFLLDLKIHWYILKTAQFRKRKQNNCTGPTWHRAYSKVSFKQNWCSHGCKAEEWWCGVEKPIKPSLKRKYSAKLWAKAMKHEMIWHEQRPVVEVRDKS